MNNILTDREKRIEFIQSFFNENINSSAIIVKANIPGNNKNMAVAYHLVTLFKNILVSDLKFEVYMFLESYDGPYYIMKSPDKDVMIKNKLIEIENKHPLGRLIDLDFYVEANKSISRKDLNLEMRKCLICDDYSHICSRSQKHTVGELLATINLMFFNYYKENISELVNQSILRELNLENKFGLVTPTTSGSHIDMDYKLMIIAKNSLIPYFNTMFEIGYYTKDLTTVLASVRTLGIVAENIMFEATNGVNCYKGIIFLLGISLLSLGYTLNINNSFDDIFKNIKIISQDIMNDFNTYMNTAGTRFFKDYNITGIRGIVYNGLDVISKHLNKDISDDDVLLQILYEYIISIDDTVFIKRSLNYENYLKHKSYFKNFDITNKNDVKILNEYSLKNNLSFGGSADLLIVTIFFNLIKNIFF